MIKYSFGEDEEYVALKQHEYDNLIITNEDTCRTYQEIFRRMDEGWMDLAGKEIDKIGEVSIIWNPTCVVVMLDLTPEFRRLQPVSKQVTMPVYFERGGSRDPASISHEIILSDALVASHARTSLVVADHQVSSAANVDDLFDAIVLDRPVDS
ncbi:hypothetical protein Tco_0233036 [Tanacetum coccineum]